MSEDRQTLHADTPRDREETYRFRVPNVKGQGHTPSEHAERFLSNNWRTPCRRIVKLYLWIPQETRTKPIDFGGQRSKVKVTGPPYMPNSFRPITGERLAAGSSNITCGHPQGQGGNLLISGAEGQRSRSQAHRTC